jgi:hypothetical protein
LLKNVDSEQHLVVSRQLQLIDAIDIEQVRKSLPKIPLN